MTSRFWTALLSGISGTAPAYTSVLQLTSRLAVSMNMLRSFTLLLFVATLGAVGAQAQSDNPVVSLQIGGVTIRVPTPQGFTETSRRSQELWNLALANSAGDARIIGHFVTDKDFAAFEKGKIVIFREFLLVQTPLRAESLTVTQSQFDKLRSGTVALQTDLSKHIEPRLTAEIDRVSKAVSSTQGINLKVHIGEIVPVSVDRNDSSVLIYTVLSQAGASDGKASTNQTMVVTTAYCFVSGKVVML
ncbi:MAG TPA: hypothetical protein PLW86_15275, partial [Rhodocyclaceae bacterium]|nr:hypothetical protein [Rhodocyclaceae bacterium]